MSNGGVTHSTFSTVVSLLLHYDTVLTRQHEPTMGAAKL
jgi:hypothetical protein